MHCIESVDVFHSRQRFQTQTGDLACSVFLKYAICHDRPCPTLWVHVSVAIVLHYAL